MPRDLLFGLGRMWEAYIDKIPWLCKIVRTKEEAENFINSCAVEKELTGG